LVYLTSLFDTISVGYAREKQEKRRKTEKPARIATQSVAGKLKG
jgi:hypothetical protein